MALTNYFEDFNLTQSVSGPTYECRHTLDLDLSYGFDISHFKAFPIRVSKGLLRPLEQDIKSTWY